GKSEGYRQWRDRLLYERLVPGYRVVLRRLLAMRYLTVATAFAILVVSLGLVSGGRVGYTFLPSDDAESVAVNITLPPGTGMEHTRRVTEVVEQVSNNQSQIKSMLSLVGLSTSMESGAGLGYATNLSQIFLELEPAETRDLNAQAVLTNIRADLDGKIPGVERLTTSEMTGGPIMEDITIRVNGDDLDRMIALSEVIKSDLRRFDGVDEIGDDLDDGQRELHIELKPSAAPLGFSVSDVAAQVRGTVYGIDAHVFSDEREDIDVRVRAAGGGDDDLASIEQMWLIGNTGTAVPLSEVAEVSDGSGYTGISRVDRRRSMTVTAETADGLSPELVVASLPIDEWRRAFPDLEVSLKGRQENQRDAFQSLPIGLMTSILLIYLILAWLFGSYGLPLTVMAAIPFGLVGVVWGHLLLGYELTFLSIIGFVALSGIVVNDSLILVDFYLGERKRGMSIPDALVSAGGMRLRPILLTTVTTVLGLTPLMLEQSFQAKFLVPMAIAIAFGLMAATFLILLILPCMILILDDFRAASYFLWFGRRRARDVPIDAHTAHGSPTSVTGEPMSP
ncbi:MAG: efflux RND transporter permease subunit, partial [Planctomycetota bacterium]|nr:efflux RND transporter permease subunit [Planctomycetota bacterium]